MLKSFFKTIAVWSGKKELAGFLNGLRGANSREIRMIVAIVHMHRLNIEARGVNLSEITGEHLISTEHNTQICNMLRGLILELQQAQRGVLAVGLMVWLHSVRASDMIEMRYLARQMWQELSKGFDSAQGQFEVLDDAGLLMCNTDCNSSEINFHFIPERYT